MTKIRVECSECLAHDSFEADLREMEAEYRAAIMCENVMVACGHDVTDLVVVIDGVDQMGLCPRSAH